MPGYDTIPSCYTETDLSNKQGYFVIQAADYVVGKGIKVSIPSTGNEIPLGIIIRGNLSTLASATNPLSVSVARRGHRVPVIAGSGDLHVGDKVGTDSSGYGVTKTAEGSIMMGVCVKAATSGNIAEMELDGPSLIGASD